MKKKIKILFFIPSLRAGGAERIMSFIAQNIDKKYFAVKLIVVGSKEDAKFSVDDIQVIFLDKKRVSKAILRIFKVIYREKPNIAFGAIGHINITLGIASLFFRKTKFIGREVNVISVVSKVESYKDFFPKWLTSYFMNRLNKIVCQSNDMAIDFKQTFNVYDGKIEIVSNPVSKLFDMKEKTISNPNPFKLITIASLSKRKGHRRILKALKRVKVPFEYTIVGDGPLRDEIFQLATELDLQNQINHIPFSKEVNRLLKNHDLFLLGSYVEGFPNVLLESCASGTPVLTFDILGGINEIVIDGINGFIANDIEEYARKIEIAHQHDWKPELIRESVVKKYNQEIILSKYEDLFKKVVAQ